MMEKGCKRFYDSWREAERALRESRDRRLVVTLPKVSIQAKAEPEEAADVR